ncbi:hypothetical protein [uncultured Corynebacterium sp.]|uniref:hypothetical protein n=1 Tax=uncultured Corynebacterium sp. TaxID=159447 RepID=UPI00262F7743|nr:hypothetical protein [uncultured Corynebacterium sp.]
MRITPCPGAIVFAEYCGRGKSLLLGGKNPPQGAGEGYRGKDFPTPGAQHRATVEDEVDV